MNRPRCAVALLGALAAVLSMAVAPPASAGHAHHVDRIDLPDGWQPEGITTDGRALYVGSLADGALWKADPRTGKGRILADGMDGRVAVGVDHDGRRHLVWVAGGGTAEIRAHDARTGRVKATYTFESENERFVNDLVVTRRGVFATDSMNQELLVVPLHKGKRLPAPPAARTLPLTGDLEYAEGFNLNGIVRHHGRLLAVQSNTGLLFRIDPWSGRTRTVDLGGYLLTNGDGLEIRGHRLFVVRNQLNLVAVLHLSWWARSGRLLAERTSDDFDVPTTAALVGRSLWAVNARFNTTPEPDTDYWITRLRVRR
jgi:sugar lactone lactonase YvrE